MTDFRKPCSLWMAAAHTWLLQHADQNIDIGYRWLYQDTIGSITAPTSHLTSIWCVCNLMVSVTSSVSGVRGAVKEGTGEGSSEITYPEDDCVFSLKYWDKLISADNFGLVQWTKSTQHLDIAFCVCIIHCVERNLDEDVEKEKKMIKKITNQISPCATFFPVKHLDAGYSHRLHALHWQAMHLLRVLGATTATFIKEMCKKSKKKKTSF